jgi:hypothetical protein
MPSLPDWDTIKSFIVALGWTKGVFSLFFFIAHAWIFWLYRGRLKDRQAEIERVVAENRQYRERFLKFYDDKFGYKPPKPKGGK